MSETVRRIGQGLVHLAAAALVGYFSRNPVYRAFPSDRAQIVLAFAHGGARVEECRRLSYEEIRALPPGERRPSTCRRERRPVLLRLALDGEVLLDEVLPPTGLSGDGPSRIYREFAVPPGPHCVEAALDETGAWTERAWRSRVTVSLRPLDRLAVDFKADKGGFLYYNVEVDQGCR